MITVVIPSYNQEEYLGEAIESVLNQTLKADEIIVVNDGSTDNSLEIARKYPVKVIDQVNKGLASARNTGIMNAKGDRIMFLDADDIMIENCLEVMSKIDADVVAPSFRCFGKSNHLVQLVPNITLDLFSKYQNYLPYCCMYKKQVLLDVGGYSPRMTWGWEDLHLHINLLSNGIKYITIQEPLILYRTKENSMWTNSVLHSFELKEQLKKDFPNVF